MYVYALNLVKSIALVIRCIVNDEVSKDLLDHFFVGIVRIVAEPPRILVD